MNKDDELVVNYYDWKEENDRINQSIISEVKRKSLEQGIQQGLEQGILKNQKEIVLNMYNNELSIEMIAKFTNLSIQQVKEIISGIENK